MGSAKRGQLALSARTRAGGPASSPATTTVRGPEVTVRGATTARSRGRTCQLVEVGGPAVGRHEGIVELDVEVAGTGTGGEPGEPVGSSAGSARVGSGRHSGRGTGRRLRRSRPGRWSGWRWCRAAWPAGRRSRRPAVRRHGPPRGRPGAGWRPPYRTCRSPPQARRSWPVRARGSRRCVRRSGCAAAADPLRRRRTPRTTAARCGSPARAPPRSRPRPGASRRPPEPAASRGSS